MNEQGPAGGMEGTWSTRVCYRKQAILCCSCRLMEGGRVDMGHDPQCRRGRSGGDRTELEGKWVKEKQGIGFTTQRRRHPRNRFPRSIHDQAKKKYILRCFYPLYSYRRDRALRRLRRETPGHFERRLSLFSDNQEGEHDVFQERKGGLVNGQRELLRTRLGDESALAFIVQLRMQISSWTVGTRTKTSPDLKSVII